MVTTQQVGDRIAGRYEVLSVLGRGGMGIVYAVRDHELGDVVALKVLTREKVESPELLSRFREEVRLARRVTHRNVARTFDIGEHEGMRFLTMELVEGALLSTLLDATGPLPIATAMEVARQMARGVAAAHEAGVVHRDLKPENVSIAKDGRVVIMDFGIARTTHVEEALAITERVWGTPAYMAPEQVEGLVEVDARADVYAFGTVLYEMLTGEVAWTASSPYLVATARLTSPPPDVRARRVDVPFALAELVTRCMARDPAERFEDGAALLRALDTLPDLPMGGAWSLPPATIGAPGGFERRQGSEGFREDIAQQLTLMGDASPSYRRVLVELDALLAAEAGRTVRDGFARIWQKRTFEGPYERPLLFLAALRSDARAEGRSHPLHAAIAAESPDRGAVTAGALQAALARERIGFWITLRTRRVQTNETARSLAWLWPATLAGAGARARPLLLFDVGTSAGLNLTAEAVSVPWRRSTGETLPIARDVDVRARIGFDARPLDVHRAEDRDWLRACIWPEQRDREKRLDAAIVAFDAAMPAPQLLLLRASSAPARIEATTQHHPGHLAVAFQTLLRGYVPVEERDAYEAGMRAWLAAGRKGERIWSVLELADMSRQELSCALDVHVGTGGGVESVRLGRTSYHPLVIEATPGAEAHLASLFR